MNKEIVIKISIPIIILTFLCLIFFIIFSFSKESDKSTSIELKLVKTNEYSTFFAIVNDINEYFNYIREKNEQAVLDLLFENYKVKNKVTSQNVMEKIFLENENQLFQAKEIYEQEVNGNYLYLAKGNLVVNEFEENKIINNNFQIFVLIDYETYSYAVFPIDNEITSPLTTNEINISKNYYNQILTTGIISNEFICNLYYGEFINTLYTNIKASYNYLSDDFKQKYPINEYVKYFDVQISNISSQIDNCQLAIEDNYKIYIISDINGNLFKFKEKSIMDFEIEFSLNN